MCPLSNTARSDCHSQTSSEVGDITAAFTGKDHYQNLIDLASTVPLVKIFKHYAVHYNDMHYKITCPFKSHKGGRESTASFKYYSETNSFCCFGCRTGGPFAHAPHFVAAMDGISLVKAAVKVLELFKDNVGDVDDDNYLSPVDADGRLKIMMDFSNTVRDFYQTYATEEARVYVERACEAYDQINLRHKSLDNEALFRTVEQLKDYINHYKP